MRRATTRRQETQIRCVDVGCWRWETQGKKVIVKAMAYEKDATLHFFQQFLNFKSYHINCWCSFEFAHFNSVNFRKTNLFPGTIRCLDTLRWLLLLFWLFGYGAVLVTAFATQKTFNFGPRRRRFISFCAFVFFVRLDFGEWKLFFVDDFRLFISPLNHNYLLIFIPNHSFLPIINKRIQNNLTILVYDGNFADFVFFIGLEGGVDWVFSGEQIHFTIHGNILGHPIYYIIKEFFKDYSKKIARIYLTIKVQNIAKLS